jgi:ATPase family associated with various cellular activities (AAA)
VGWTLILAGFQTWDELCCSILGNARGDPAMQDITTSSAHTPFTNLPRTAGGHFMLHFYAVVARVLSALQSAPFLERNDEKQTASLFEKLPFLAGYQTMLMTIQAMESPSTSSPNGDWWDAQITDWEDHVTAYLPLHALAREAELSAREMRLLIAAGLVEEDIRFGALFAALQEPLIARRPCIGALGWLLSDPGMEPADLWPACRTLLDMGLLLVENHAAPRAEWLLRVPPALWDAIRGQPPTHFFPGCSLEQSGDFPLLPDVILPDSLHSQVMRIPDLIRDGQIGAVVVRGMAGSGRHTILGAVARALGRDVLLWEEGKPGDDSWRLLGPLATLTGALPVLRCDSGPGETLDLPSLPGYSGPVGIAMGRSGGLRGSLLTHALSLNLPPPGRDARRRFWEATHVPVQPGMEEEIVARFLLTGGYIHRAAGLSQAYAALEHRPTITTSDVQQATRALNRQALETLATPLEASNGWNDLVVSGAVMQELHGLAARCRGRETLREHTGAAFHNNLNRGVRALFSGPSGTGKTLAARVLAAALQMDLYRVDLAAVVNKYIGETERNLNQVFSRAEELDVMLLLDEGDALMTRRTDVRNANDRYANLETNYLLQRLENYEGIVIITTNAGNRIDPAFLRRLDVIIDFAPPSAAERWLIWQHHLPPSHAISVAFLEEVATRCTLTGGQVRNAALHATLLALDASEAVNDIHLEAAIQREYRKAGATCPLRPKPAPRGQVDRLRQFAAELG